MMFELLTGLLYCHTNNIYSIVYSIFYTFDLHAIIYYLLDNIICLYLLFLLVFRNSVFSTFDLLHCFDYVL